MSLGCPERVIGKGDLQTVLPDDILHNSRLLLKKTSIFLVPAD